MASTSLSHQPSFSEYEKSFLASEMVYEVFINRPDSDVTRTLAFALYGSLRKKGLETFLDEEMENPFPINKRGDPEEMFLRLCWEEATDSEIENAIYSSKVQIAIFSPSFAEATWCLDELVLMHKAASETNSLFISVFYDVEPSDLRYPDMGVYAPALARHQENGRYSKEILQQWTDALSSASFWHGYVLRTSNDNVRELCKMIVWDVQQVIRKRHWPMYSHSHPVGIDSKVEEILNLIEDPKNPVLALVGMGGIGKTFLLQNVYDKIKSTFDISIWLSVSKSYSIKNLHRGIAFQSGLKEEIVYGAVSEERAAQLIHERLHSKRCLIVLDDLCTFSIADNLLSKLGLPLHKYCKIVVTTRNKEVAQILQARIYQVKILSEEESSELFLFYACEDCRDQKFMEQLGREVIKQCWQLPLAIKTLAAASLCKTSNLGKWLTVRNWGEKAFITLGEHAHVMDILKFSYDCLPEHLKPCFAYLSVFPQGEEIDPEYLVYLWIAEGFVQLIPEEQQWDRAWNWLHQLDRLCMLQLYEDLQVPYYGVKYSDEIYLTKYCKIHDMLHDLAIDISRQDISASAFSVEEAFTQPSRRNRILLAKKDIRSRDLLHNIPPHIRTLFLSQNWLVRSIPDQLFDAMEGLLVLDLSSTDIYTLPASVGKLSHLQVVNLRNTAIQKVPACVRGLKSLLFLALPMTCILLPDWINELKCLQHLECMGGLHAGIYNMFSLRILRSRMTLQVKDDLAKMTRLEEVKLRVQNDVELQIVPRLENLRHVEVIYLNPQTKPLQFSDSMTAMKHLKVLKLCRIQVQSRICGLTSLRELSLRQCAYIDFPEFQKMPNLVRLDLNGNKGCKEIPKAFGMSGGFPRLRFFRIYDFSELEEFPPLQEGSMPYLEEFELRRCKKLKNVKKVGENVGLERLKRLKKFTFEG